MITQRESHWSVFGLATNKKGGPSSVASAPPDSANLRGWVDSLDLDGTNNSTLVDAVALASIVNKGTLGGTFGQATALSRPTFRTLGGPGNLARVEFDGGDTLASSLAAVNWVFLNDGTSFTTYTVARTTSTNPTTLQGIWGTTPNGAATQVGSVLYFRDQATSEDRILFSSVNGTATVWNLQSAIGSAISGLWQAITARVDATNSMIDISNVNAATTAKGAMGGTPPNSTLVLGAAVNTEFLTGSIAALLIYNGAHDAPTRANVQTYLQSRYGVASYPAT